MSNQQMTDDELRALLDQEIRQSAGYLSGKLSQDRQKALAYYLAKPVGDLAPPEIDGRSSVVSTDVADTVEWMLPSLLRIFAGSDKVVEFNPTHPSDEAAARQATSYVNYVFRRQNPGFQILYTWFKDALMQKTGILKVWWEDREDAARETYTGLNDLELAHLLNDPELQPVEHATRPDEDAIKAREQALQLAQKQLAQMQAAPVPPPQQALVQQQVAQLQQQMAAAQAEPMPVLHDVVVKRVKKRAQMRVDNVAPEDFLISRRAKTIASSPFSAHRVQRTVSELRALGYRNLDAIGNDEAGQTLNPERVERASADDDWAGMAWANENSADESQRLVWVVECYLQVDFDGDGIAEWRKVTRCGDALLDNEECDGPPFVSVTPIPMPHRFQGLSVADQAMPIQKAKTSVLRAALDNLYLQVNGRYFAVEGQANLDDLLASRPGGVVRVKNPGAAGRLDQGMGDIGSAFQMLEFLETQKENRTGWTRMSQGAGVDALQNTATGVNVNTNRADARVELIARVFAETGVKDLFLMILKLVCQHQDKPAQMEVAGQWQLADPRTWRNQFHISVNVGLGTGNRDQVVQHLMALMQVQQQGLALGVALPQNLYKAAVKLAENLQLPQPEQFFNDPGTGPMPSAPPPEQAQAQALMQVEQHKATLQAQVDQNRQQMEAQRHALQVEADKQLAQFKAQIAAAGEAQQLQFDRWKAELQDGTARWTAELQANTQVLIAQMRQAGQGEVQA